MVFSDIGHGHLERFRMMPLVDMKSETTVALMCSESLVPASEQLEVMFCSYGHS